VNEENYEKTQSAITSVHNETWVEQIALSLTAKLSVCLIKFYTWTTRIQTEFSHNISYFNAS